MEQSVSVKFRYSYLLSAVLIMIMHASGGMVGNKASIESIMCWVICKCGIPALAWFIFASAYFMFRDYKNDYRNIISKKVKTLLVPYIVWNIIGFLWYRLVYDRVFHVDTKITMTLLIKAFIPYKSANGGLWTMALFMLCSIMSPIIFFLCKRKGSLGIILFGELCVIIGLKTTASFLYWFPLYLLGAYVAIHHKESIERYLSMSGGG